jgi:subtilisin family serine protease
MLTPLAYNDAVARGIVHKSVQSISIGGDLYTPVNNLANAIVKGGMTIVVAAGNENVNAKTKSPASASDVLTIAASDINDARASFSNFGSRVDLFGPGVDVLSSYNSCDSCYYYMSGTSMGKFDMTSVKLANSCSYSSYFRPRVVFHRKGEYPHTKQVEAAPCYSFHARETYKSRR